MVTEYIVIDLKNKCILERTCSKIKLQNALTNDDAKFDGVMIGLWQCHTNWALQKRWELEYSKGYPK